MRRAPFRAAIAAACLALASASPSWSQTPMPPPKISQAEATRLLEAAGFTIGPSSAINLCGTPSTPKVTYLDLNGDGLPEALAVDRNPSCYGEPGDWFTVVKKDASGKWRAILRDTGVLRWEQTRTKDWLDARRSGGGRCDRIARYDGDGYVQSSDCVPGAAQAKAAPPGAPAGAAPAANDLTVAERAAIFQAAGMAPRGRDWVGCDGNTTASIEQGDVRDINGDGALDAVVTERGIACYGQTEQGFHLLTRGAGGRWQLVHASPGIPEFLKSSGKGWPDLEIGGPGFCFPIERWDGKGYVFHRNHEYEPGACAGR